MSRQGRRLNRLPQRLDYTLIPAPLDLSLPTLSPEKSPVPAIIVTPSSPTQALCDSPFFIAFSPKPTFRDRVSNYITLNPLVNLHARTTIILSILLFIVICHFFTHQFGLFRPHLRFDQFESAAAAAAASHDGSNVWGWVGIKELWNASFADEKRGFIINEPLTNST